MEPLVVYTVISGSSIKDQLHYTIAPKDPAGRPVQYVCFSDQLIKAMPHWRVQPLRFEHRDPRRAARWHKCMSHDLFRKAEVTLWHDGSHQLRVNPWALVDRYLPPGYELATFKHPERSNIQAELRACIKLKKDDPILMTKQVNGYHHGGYVSNELFETTVMLRRHTQGVCLLNEMWWREIVAGSVRDQLSINYVVDKLSIPYTHLAGHREKSPYFNFFSHRV